MQYRGWANLPFQIDPVPRPTPKRLVTSASKSQIRPRRVRNPLNPEVTMTRASPFTIEFPTPLSLQSEGAHWWLEGERRGVRKRLEPSKS